MRGVDWGFLTLQGGGTGRDEAPARKLCARCMSAPGQDPKTAGLLYDKVERRGSASPHPSALHLPAPLGASPVQGVDCSLYRVFFKASVFEAGVTVRPFPVTSL